MPPLKYGRSEMTKPLELSMGAENSNVMSLAKYPRQILLDRPAHGRRARKSADDEGHVRAVVIPVEATIEALP